MIIEKKRAVFLLVIFVFLMYAFVASISCEEGSIWIIINLLMLNLFIGTSKGKNRYVFVLFNFTFFTFLVSQLFFNKLDKKAILSSEFVSFTETITNQVILCLSVALVFLTIGMLIGERIGQNNEQKSKNFEVCIEKTAKDNSLLIQIVKIAYYISFPLYLITVIEKSIYVSATSYIDYYTTYVSSIPYLLIKIGELNVILFAMLFSVEYRKKKLAIPVFLYLLGSVLSLGIGQRNIFVLNAVMLSVCLNYANKRSIAYEGKALYTKKQVMVILLLIPFVISFLYFWGNYRQDVNDEVVITDGIKNFFVSQGGQITFFANTIKYKQDIWSQKVPYTFASIYNYFRNLFGLIDYGTYTRENALVGNSLGVTQFYLTSPSSLEAGKGAGGCYLSELYFDAGIPGIILGSMFIGYILSKLYVDESRTAWANAFIFVMIRQIIYIPRASYFDWVTVPFNIWNITIIILIYFATNFVRKSRRK